MEEVSASSPPESDLAPPGFPARGFRGRWPAFACFILLSAAVGVAAGGIWQWRSPILAVGVASVGIVLLDLIFRGWKRWWGRVVGTLLVIAGAVPLTVGVVQLYCWYGPRPEPERQMLYRGVEYVREVVTEPDAAVVHILVIDLAAEGVKVLVTPPDWPERDLPLKARTTSQFVREFGVQAAVNANLFGPFRKMPWWDIYPWPGDPVQASSGAASAGVNYGEPYRYHPILNVDEDGRAEIAMQLPRPWYNAVAGVKHFIKDGKPIWVGPDEGPGVQTVAAIDKTGRKLILAVSDGEQPPYAAGIRRTLLAEMLIREGAHDAIALDGGGSSTMVVANDDGSPRRLNRPFQGPLPCVERPVGNHLGVYAKPLPPE